MFYIQPLFNKADSLCISKVLPASKFGVTSFGTNTRVLYVDEDRVIILDTTDHCLKTLYRWKYPETSTYTVTKLNTNGTGNQYAYWDEVKSSGDNLIYYIATFNASMGNIPIDMQRVIISKYGKITLGAYKQINLVSISSNWYLSNYPAFNNYQCYGNNVNMILPYGNKVAREAVIYLDPDNSSRDFNIDYNVAYANQTGSMAPYNVYIGDLGLYLSSVGKFVVKSTTEVTYESGWIGGGAETDSSTVMSLAYGTNNCYRRFGTQPGSGVVYKSQNYAQNTGKLYNLDDFGGNWGSSGNVKNYLIDSIHPSEIGTFVLPGESQYAADRYYTLDLESKDGSLYLRKILTNINKMPTVISSKKLEGVTNMNLCKMQLPAANLEFMNYEFVRGSSSTTPSYIYGVNTSKYMGLADSHNIVIIDVTKFWD